MVHKLDGKNQGLKLKMPISGDWLRKLQGTQKFRRNFRGNANKNSVTNQIIGFEGDE